MPPTTQGFVALEMLKILEGFDLKSAGPQGADALHWMIEAKKLAFTDRDRHLADQGFHESLGYRFLSSKRVETYAVGKFSSTKQRVST